MPSQLLGGECQAEVHVHRGQVVHPVGVRNPLDGREVLAALLGAAMQVADVGFAVVDDFAVGLEEQPKDTVGRGMLRPHVDEHLVGADVEFDFAGIFDEEGHGEVRGET